MTDLVDVVVDAREVRVGERVVGFYDYGDPTGTPVFALHGVPACGAGFGWTHEPASSRGMRVIAPDRPGVGLSSPFADGERGTVGDHQGWLDALADALGVDTYAVLGYSGGGPYAVAAAMAGGGRVTSVAVAAGMGQVGVWAEIGDFEKTDAQLLRLATRRPRVARVIMAVSARLARMAPGSAMKSFVKQLAPSDRDVLRSIGSPKQAMRLFTESCSRSARGVVDDYATLSGPWGLELGAPSMPVTVWQGDADTMVPIAHARALVAALPGAELVVWPGEGHLGPITHIGEILDRLRP